MPKSTANQEILSMALVGYEIELEKVVERMKAIRTALSGRKTRTATVDEAAPLRKRKRRKMSAAARKRIGDATRARWAALRATKATTTKRNTSKKLPKLSAAERLKISGGQATVKNEVPF